MSNAAHPLIDEEEAESASDSATAEDSDKDWLVSELRGPTKTVQFTTTEATWINVDLSPDGRTIAFDVLGDIYLLPAGGGKATPLTEGPAYDHQPRFSPDGSRILFTSDRGGTDNVWVIHTDGTQLRPLTNEKDRFMNSADWSPDGSTIVARKRLTDASSLGTVELWMFHTLGGKGSQLTKKASIPDANAPTLSPDGKWVYFAFRNRRYQYNRNVYQGIWQIRALELETGRMRTITDGYGGSGRPRLSPDGSTMAFIRRDREKTCLMLHDLESGAERVIFDGLDQDMQENFCWTGVYPGYDWSADGGSIVISYGGQIHRVNAADGSTRLIPFEVDVSQVIAETLRPRQDIAPETIQCKMIAWPGRSPDGRWLVFSAMGKIYRQRVSGGEPQLLQSEGPRAYCPTLSPDGKSIAYASWSDAEGGHIWTMPASGGSSRRVTKLPGQYANPAYSSDGSKLVFVKGVGAGIRGHYLGREHNLELFWAPASGGTPTFVKTISNRGSSRAMPKPKWSADDKRIYYVEDRGSGTNNKASLISVRTDGTEERVHIKIRHAEEIVPSPDGKWVAYNRLFEGFVAPMPQNGNVTLNLDGKGGPVPVHQFADEGVTWLNWSPDSKALTWSLGPRAYALELSDVEREWMEAGVQAGEKTIPKPAVQDTTDAEETPELFTAKPDTIDIHLTFPRHVPQGTVVLEGARLITMNGAEVIDSGVIVVEGDKISAVGPKGQVAVPSGARVIDMTGKTIMPGMIDAHAHMHYNHLEIIPETMSTYYANLAYGVTTTHDPSASTYNVFTQSEMVEAGITKGPRTFSTGFILYGADIPNKAVINNPEDARKHIRRLKTLGAFSVKSYMQPRREQRQWVIQAAREENMLVMPEGGGNLEANLGMVIDGHTGIEHSLPVAPVYNDIVQLFAQSGAGYTPTLLVSYGGLSGEHWFYQNYEIWQDEKLLTFLPRRMIDARARRRPVMATDDDWHHMTVAQGCRAIVEAGGKVQLGAHGQLQGLGAHWELWALTQGGMNNHDALRCATLFGAEYLGIDHLLGSLEPGKLADLVVLDRDPLADITNSNSVLFVMKNGEMFEGDTMNQVWPQESPRPVFYWSRAYSNQGE